MRRGSPRGGPDASVHVEIADGIAVIALDGHGRAPRFTDQVEADLDNAFALCDIRSDVRVIVLTSRDDAFCTGLDLGPGAATLADWRRSPTAPAGTVFAVEGEDLPVRRDGGGRVALRIFESAVPVIAAVPGPAIGVGATMLLPCDVRLASTAASFGFVFGRRGLPPESCSSWFLPRLVGMPTALDWVLGARTVDADEALAAGLVRSVHPPEALMPAALRLARELADECSPTATSVARRLLWSMVGAPHPMAAHRAETWALNRLGVGTDATEGIEAFLARRPTSFPDRDPGTVADALRLDVLPHPMYHPEPHPTTEENP